MASPKSKKTLEQLHLFIRDLMQAQSIHHKSQSSNDLKTTDEKTSADVISKQARLEAQLWQQLEDSQPSRELPYFQHLCETVQHFVQEPAVDADLKLIALELLLKAAVHRLGIDMPGYDRSSYSQAQYWLTDDIQQYCADAATDLKAEERTAMLNFADSLETYYEKLGNKDLAQSLVDKYRHNQPICMDVRVATEQASTHSLAISLVRDNNNKATLIIFNNGAGAKDGVTARYYQSKALDNLTDAQIASAVEQISQHGEPHASLQQLEHVLQTTLDVDIATPTHTEQSKMATANICRYENQQNMLMHVTNTMCHGINNSDGNINRMATKFETHTRSQTLETLDNTFKQLSQTAQGLSGDFQKIIQLAEQNTSATAANHSAYRP